ncbi:hypothetical protein EP7_001813 [Isosphaeraceae bacterium EP7]
MILDGVLPSGGAWPIPFVNGLYTHADGAEVRLRFFRATLERTPDDTSLSAPERLRLEALARAGLGESNLAKSLWVRALALEPSRAEWREEFITWLVARGEAELAYRQAVIGEQLNPEHQGLRRAVLSTAGTLARTVPAP